MKKYKFIVVVLVYRNYDDLEDFIISLQNMIGDYKVIIVNSYYDEATLKKVSELACLHNCEFLNIENRGYSYGNNRGIELAKRKFQFEYLIISNPDVKIIRFESKLLEKYPNSVYGPIIHNLNSKNQNPHIAFDVHVFEKMMYESFIDNKKWKFFIYLVYEKLCKYFINFCLFFYNKPISVFSLHGSFVIFSDYALQKINLPYDEDMFLFAEENHLAHSLKEKNIKSFIVPGIMILHKEDGSLKGSKLDFEKISKNSIKTYYEKRFSEEKISK